VSDEISLKVDGQSVPLNGFVARALAGSIRGFVVELHDLGNDPQRIEIVIVKKQEGAPRTGKCQ